MTEVIHKAESGTKPQQTIESLVMVEEGVFPVTVDKDGHPIAQQPKTGWDFPGTVQGEGKLAGVPSLFVRLASCNLRCLWLLPNGDISKCDTAYASFNVGKTAGISVVDVAALIKQNLKSASHVVISGGEPMLQASGVAALCRELKHQTGAHITIESNGSLFNASVASQIDLVSLSPKLSNSEPSYDKLKRLGLNSSGPFLYHAERRRNIEVIQQWINAVRERGADIQLKFVVSNIHEEQEIKEDYLNHLTGLLPGDVLVMPLGANSTELQQTTSLVLQMAVRNGWRFSPRVHIELFGSKQGV